MRFSALTIAPAVFRAVANMFPVRHFFEAMLTAFNPKVTGSGFAPGTSASSPCGAAGLAIAVWIFQWTPSAER